MLPVLDPEGGHGRQAVANSLALLAREPDARRRPAWPARVYLVGALVLGLGFTAVGGAGRGHAHARRRARASSWPRSLYLPALCALLLVDRL